MDLKNKLRQTMSANSITARFSLGLGLLLALIVTVALTGYLSIFYIRHADNSIRISTEIQRLVLEMDRGMERARHLHADFFLQYPAIGLAEAHESYAQPSVRQVARVITISRALKELISRSPVSQALRNSRVDLNLYLSSAMRFADTSIQSVELVTQLAAPDRGLEAQLNDLFNSLRDQMRTDRLVNLYGNIRGYAQAYRIGRKRYLMQSAFNAAFELRQAVSQEPAYTADQRQHIENLLDQFKATAEKIMAVDVAIKAKFNDFALQAKAVAPISTTLIQLANTDVGDARIRISRAHRTAAIIMAAITLAGLVLAAWIAGMLNRSITRRVVRLTASAGELRKGNFNVSADEQGGDELSQLARTFNIMAGRIRDLVNQLELKVEQRTAELAESENRFRDLFEHSSSGVAIYQPAEYGQDFICKDINKAAERIDRLVREDVIGKKLTAVYPAIMEFGLLEVFRKVARTGRSARHPASFYSDGRLQGWRQHSVYRLPSGELVTVYDDLTAQKQTEIEKKAMEIKLHQAQKMEAIGVLSGGIAHDFNNILGIILGNAELAIDDIPDWNPVALHLQEIRTACLRAKEVIRQLLSFSRQSERMMKPVAIIPIIKESLALMRASIPTNIEIRQSISEDCGAVVADPTQIHQVMINLCTNAAHAMEETGGVLRVEVTPIQFEDKDAAIYPGAEPGPYVQLTVSDTGCGMEDDVRARIFDPYFTTKEIGKGTGMGLAVVHGIVKNHGGIISVYSAPGRGSTFKLCFPATEDNVPAAEPEHRSMPGGTERILLIDDETALLKSIGRILERLGYGVEATTDPEAALDLLLAEPEAFDLVITDMAMPKITGAELAERILRMQPTMPIILCSGYSDSIDAERAEAIGIRKYMDKPFKTHDLATAIREVLDQQAHICPE